MRILVIDDDVFMRKSISLVLQKNGYEVIEAPDGETGVELARSNLPDLIICDVVMPGIDGFQVKKILEGVEELQTTPFIFLTSKSDLDSKVAGFELGADDYIIKPFNPVELIARVKAALKRVQAFKQISTTDPLTKLPNRKAILEIIDKALAEMKSKQGSVSIAMFDIDHFKRFNDTYGHLAGDFVLASVAKFLKSEFEGKGQVGRYGGEEFVAVFPGLSCREAFELLDKTREKLSQTPFKWENTDLFITMSMGVSCFPDHGDDRTQLIERADTALYAAKESGRNRVVIYSPDMEGKNEG